MNCKQEHPNPSAQTNLLEQALALGEVVVFKYNLHSSTFEYISRNVSECIDLSSEELYAKGKLIIPDLIHQDDMINILEFLNSVRRNRELKSDSVRFRLNHGGGKYKWKEARVQIISDIQNNNNLTLLGICRDIHNEVETIQSYAREATYFKILNEISKESGFPTKKNMSEILDLLADFLNMETCVYARMYGDTWTLISASSRAQEPFDEKFTCKLDDTVCQFITDENPLVIPDTDHDDRIIGLNGIQEFNIKSYVGVPVRKGNTTLSYLVFFNQRTMDVPQEQFEHSEFLKLVSKWLLKRESTFASFN